nr:helix-turn-helix domain-containing protein [Clostridium beijerinckii]
MDIKEKGLLLIIFRYINYKTRYADPSRTLIKKLTGISDNRTLDKLFDSLIDKGYLIRESGRGKRSTYFIKVGGEITPRVINAPSGESTLRVSGKITPILGGDITPQKEKKNKIKENNIYSHIFEYWNSKKIIVHKSLTKEIEKAIEKVLKKYSEIEIVQAIDIYSEILESDFYFNYKWSLIDFLSRKNGISTFMEDGSNKANYESWKKEREHNGNTNRSTKRDRGVFNKNSEDIKIELPEREFKHYTNEELAELGID